MWRHSFVCDRLLFFFLRLLITKPLLFSPTLRHTLQSLFHITSISLSVTFDLLSAFFALENPPASDRRSIRDSCLIRVAPCLPAPVYRLRLPRIQWFCPNIPLPWTLQNGSSALGGPLFTPRRPRCLFASGCLSEPLELSFCEQPPVTCNPR